MMRRLGLIAWLLGLLAAAPAWAVRPGEQLADPMQEARARRLSAELRCLVCQNQSIDDSEAVLAQDLRRLVRERILAGDSDAAILDFLVARFGEFVLLKPRLSSGTLLLWGLPVAALVLGGAMAIGVFRRRADPAPADGGAGPALTEAERENLRDLLGPAGKD